MKVFPSVLAKNGAKAQACKLERGGEREREQNSVSVLGKEILKYTKTQSNLSTLLECSHIVLALFVSGHGNA